MPNFYARFTAGVTPTIWQDARTNPKQGHPPRYQRATIGVELVIKATVNGVEGRPDSELGGFLFTADFIEYPTAALPVMTPDVAFSTIQRFTPTQLGHYFVLLRREDGGAIGFHFDVES